MGWLDTGDIAITVLTSAMPAGRLEDIGQRKPASLEIEHATVEMVIEQLGRKPRTSFGSEDCNLNQIPRDYTMQITRWVKSSG